MLLKWVKTIMTAEDQSSRGHSAFERAQGEFVQRRAQRRVLSRLERKVGRFIQEAQRKELKQLDEVASNFPPQTPKEERGG